MFNVFTEQFDVYDCMFEVEVNGVKQMQRVRAPRILIEQQFMSFVQDAASDRRPVKITLSREVECVSDWTGECFVRENSITFKNRYYEDNEDNMQKFITALLIRLYVVIYERQKYLPPIPIAVWDRRVI